LLDALKGDPSLFTRGDRAELAWELLDPIMKAWKEPDGPPLYSYAPGSWDPAAADQLLEKDNRKHINHCPDCWEHHLQRLQELEADWQQ
jgi:glucose-6-phosphate 1-dehydrogenase